MDVVLEPAAGSLLRSRLTPPRVPADYLIRPEVQNALDRHPYASILQFCAPAGFGKTTALAALAGMLAGKSPLALRGTKQVLNYSRDHSVAEGLEQVAHWNAAMLISSDIQAAVMAQMQGQTPMFAD